MGLGIESFEASESAIWNERNGGFEKGERSVLGSEKFVRECVYFGVDLCFTEVAKRKASVKENVEGSCSSSC